MSSLKTLSFLFIISILTSCEKDPDPNLASFEYDPQPYQINYPPHFPPPLQNPDNPLTVDGVALGRKLFYDPILSGDSSQSCASCHKQAFAFSDGLATSPGIDGVNGNRNSMALINLAWTQELTWDGRAQSLEEQGLEPVPNPIEMHLPWADAEQRLKNHPTYPFEFYAAFGDTVIDSNRAAMALSQFVRTLISADAKIDKVFAQNVIDLTQLSPLELQGFDLYTTEQADCFHCHDIPLTTNDNFHNNGLDASFTDFGRSLVTNNSLDDGKFRAPTLRNIALTAPYMHDGRFNSLDEVLDHYNFGLVHSPTIDPLMKKADQGGLLLDNQQIAALKAFLLTFTDSSFITNPDFSNPF